MPGTLFVVATPIGNLEDITLRALRVLRTVALVAAEDTRRTRILLQHYDIPTPVTSLHDHNEREKGPELLARLQAGESIAIVSDAGTPLVSDPGYLLVREAIAAQVRVESIPGPSAVMAALSVSGLPADRFVFLGFAPSKAGQRRRWLEEVKEQRGTILFFESPHRLHETLSDIAEVVGNRWLVIARELTKVHESVYRGWTTDLLDAEVPERGELVILLSDQEQSPVPLLERDDEPTIHVLFGQLTKDGLLSKRDAVARIARDRRMSRQEVYRAIDAASELGQTTNRSR